MHPQRKQEIARLLEHLDGDGPPLVITGSRGAGKSTLFEQLRDAVQSSARACVTGLIEQSGHLACDETLVAWSRSR